ncbi:MAG: hypothetical protein IJ191_02665 [Treponema sp.]|nr:hypothetical protein [Treponema sp.]
MKKLTAVLLLAAALGATSVFAQNQQQERTEDKWASISYYTVPIVKIYEASDGYLVVYQKNNTGVGSTVIPKSWNRGTADTPRKLKFRPTTGTLQPYMSVVSQDGAFLRVILTVPTSRMHHVWGVVRRGQRLNGTDKETLEKLELF